MPPSRINAAERLKRRKEEVLARWERRVRQEVAAARGAPHPILIDTLPLLLDQFADALDPASSRSSAPEDSTACQEHGGERARVTRYELSDLMHEYQILREVLFDVLGLDGPLVEEERRILRVSVDEVMKQAAAAFGLVQNQIREQFFMTLTHDLRGPLTAAQNNANLILKYADRPDQHARLASKIIQNVQRADRMITDLLDANRVHGGGRLTLKTAACDLQEIAQEVAEEVSILHRCEVRVAPGPAHGYWDPGIMKRAIENLCTNAVKYGAIQEGVDVAIAQTHGRTILSVHNHGNPIPPEEQETIFNAYQRTRTSEQGHTRGWGLGLALVRGAAEAHGGSIMLDSGEGRGTTFTIDVPTDARVFKDGAPQPFAAA